MPPEEVVIEGDVVEETGGEGDFQTQEPNVENATPDKEIDSKDIETNGTLKNEKTSGSPNKKIKYTFWDVFCVLLSLFTYTFDQVTDILVAVHFFYLGLYWYFGLTLTFVIVPSLTMTIFSITWYVDDYKQGLRPPGSRLQWVLRAICLFLNLGPILRYFESLCYGCQILRKHVQNKESYFYIMLFEDTDASLLRLFECFMESAPQLVLQIYIVIKHDIPIETDLKIGLQIVSISSSLISLSWAIASYNRSLRFSMDDKMKLTWGATIFQFFWRFFNISARVLSMALFASAFHYYIFVVCFVHWVIMTTWIFMQKTAFCKSRWEEIFFDMVMGIVYIFCFLNVKEEPTRYKTAAYHLFMLLEGTGLMVAWYIYSDPAVWYHLPALLGYFACYFMGIVLMIAYYLYFHPVISFRQQTSVNGDMPDYVLPSALRREPENHFICGQPNKLSRRPILSFTDTDVAKL